MKLVHRSHSSGVVLLPHAREVEELDEIQVQLTSPSTLDSSAAGRGRVAASIR
jgi:hypothetical protein